MTPEIYEQCGLPRALMHCSRATWDEAAMGWKISGGWHGEPWALVLLGEVGTGKSHTAAAIWKSAFHDPEPWGFGDRHPITGAPRGLRWLDVPLALAAMKRDFDGKGRLIDRWAREAQLVVLDDLGAERPTEWQWDTVSLWLRERYNQELPTIVTANAFSLKQLAREDNRIASRLRSGRVVGFKGQDQRGN